MRTQAGRGDGEGKGAIRRRRLFGNNYSVKHTQNCGTMKYIQKNEGGITRGW